jgi:hypothetical protein
MPMKRVQLAIFEASAKIFRTARKTPTCLTATGFGRLDGSKTGCSSSWDQCGRKLEAPKFSVHPSA